MIWIWTVFFILLGVMGLFWHPLDATLMAFIDEQIAAYPEGFTGSIPSAIIAFTRSISHYFLLFVAVGGLIFVFVRSQRTQPEGYYRYD